MPLATSLPKLAKPFGPGSHQGKLAYGFTPGAHPDNRQTTMSNSVNQQR
jgi:hypothetical protein